MIRVGFAIPFKGDSWLGGLRYFSNLLLAIRAIQDRRIEPVIFVGKSTFNYMERNLPDVELVGTRLLDGRHPFRLVRRASQLAFNSDAILEAALRFHGVNVWSHSGFLGRHSKIPTIGWVPDFQHRHFSNLFSRRELADRDRTLNEICRHCDTVIVSSKAAQSDAFAFYPECTTKLRVLSFVSDPTPHLNKVELEFLQMRYGFAGRYFFVPNQFWIHKNHKLILEALALTAVSEPAVQVLTTGNTSDVRQPEYFIRLMEQAQRLGVSSRFKCLGIVPYEDLICLMRNSCAVINPSLFEGWSTTVEEAKSLGKQILLSSIAVHKEQSPPRGVFFSPDDAAELATSMSRLHREWNSEAEKAEETKAMAQLHNRQRHYGDTFQEIVMETLAGQTRRKEVIQPTIQQGE